MQRNRNVYRLKLATLHSDAPTERFVRDPAAAYAAFFAAMGARNFDELTAQVIERHSAIRLAGRCAFCFATSGVAR